jgi:hypothetical protein
MLGLTVAAGTAMDGLRRLWSLRPWRARRGDGDAHVFGGKGHDDESRRTSDAPPR